MNNSINIINNELYILGGLLSNQNWRGIDDIVRYYYVKDNWKYNIKNNTWHKLNENILDVVNHGTAVENVIDNRYIILICGDGDKDNTSIPYNIINIYDTYTDKICYRDKYIKDITGLCYIVNKDKIYILAGERGGNVFKYQDEYFGCHLDLFITGTINKKLLNTL